MGNNSRSPLAKGPTINLQPVISTVNYEAPDEKLKSEYQVLWSKTMDKGTYKSSSTYTNVVVLLLCWTEKSDDLAVKEEVTKLKSTFETRFNYHAEIAYLDANLGRRLQVQVNTIVQAFIGAHDDPTTLLIVYYAGHGKPGSYYGSLVLHGQTSENDRRKQVDNDQRKQVDMLVWNKTEKLLADAEGDVLEIFDCCYAGNLCLTRENRRLFEYLAATKEMDTTPVPGPNSFTSALIYALEALVDENKRFTTVELLRMIKNEAPDFPKDQSPVLSDREEVAQAGRIMLHPLQKPQDDGSQAALSSEKETDLDPFKSQTVTLHLDFCKQPSQEDIQTLGEQMNHIFDRFTLGVNRVRWGGMKQSAAARALGSFQDSLKRSRRASMEHQQVSLNGDGSDLRLDEEDSAVLTPSPSSEDSLRLMDSSAAGSLAVNLQNLSPKLSLLMLGSNKESKG